MFNLNKTKSVLLVAIMLIAATGGALAAAPTVDTETTNTSTTSDLTNGDTQAYNATTNSTIAWSADSTDSKIIIEQGNDTLYSDTPESYSSSSGTYYYNTTVDDDGSDYSGLDADAGESVTLNVTFINDTTAANPDTTNISFTFANGQVEAFEDVGASSVETPSDGGTFSVASLAFWSDNDTDPAKTDSTVGIDGNQTETVTMSVAGTNMADALDVAAESTESGDVIWASAASLEGDYLVMTNSEAPDTDWFNDSAAYATFDADSEKLRYHNVDEWTDADAKDVELSATGNDGLGLSNTASMLQNYEMSGGDAYLTAIQHADWNEPDWESDE
jgi:hypothetical protein